MENVIDTPPPVEPTGPGLFESMTREVSAVIDPENHPAPKVPEVKAEAPKAETPKAEQPKADAPESKKDDIESIEPPKSSAAAAESFNKIKETAKGYKEKFTAAETLLEAQKAEFATREQEYQAKLKEYEAKDSELNDWKNRSTEFEEAQKELALSRVEGTKHYKDTIKAPLKAIEDRTAAIAKSNDVSRDAILDAIAERDLDKQQELLDELLPGLKPSAQLAVARMADDVREILAKKDQIENDAVTAAKEIAERTEKETAAAKEKGRKDYEGGVDHAAAELGKRFPFLALNDGETADGVMANLAKSAKETDFDAAPAGVKATAALSVLALERALVQLQKVTEENKSLTTRLNESRAAEPQVADPHVEQPSRGDDAGLVGTVESFLGLQKSHSVLASLGM